MTLAYLVSVLLLVISPIISMYGLRFVYPDIKTYIKTRKWLLFLIFGLAAYIPAAIIAFTEAVVPFYSPIGADPLMESGGNAIFMLALFLGVFVVNSSIVDFLVLRRRTMTVVGVPKDVIRYGINKEIKHIVRAKKERRAQDIKRITHELEGVLKEETGMQPLLHRIRASVAKERGMEGAELKKFMEKKIIEEVKKPLLKPSIKEKVIIAEKPEVKEIRKHLREEIMEGRKAEKLERKQIEEAKEIRRRAKEEEMTEKEPPKVEKQVEVKKERVTEKEKLVIELEDKLKKATTTVKKEEKTQNLLEELKQKIKEDKEETGREVQIPGYAEGDIEEITNTLQGMKRGEKGEGEEILLEAPRRRHMKEKKEPEIQLGAEALFTPRVAGAYPKEEEDVLKAVIGDVRQQMTEPKEEKEEKEDEGKRWYEKESAAPKETREAVPGAEPGVELFEDDLSFGGLEGGGEGLGELGEGLGELGELSDLENMNQDLESGEFDGMFVDVGETKGGCPHCGKKGTSVVYCSNCGKPLCSNCAASVEGSEDYVDYKCPHCSEEFAMKRRAAA